MYKFPNRQIRLCDFGLPMGVTLGADNRWVKKAETIPWEDIALSILALNIAHIGRILRALFQFWGNVFLGKSGGKKVVVVQ